MSLLYEVRGLVRRYGRVTALDLPALGVDELRIHSGQVLTLVGYALYFVSSISAIGDMGHLIGRGAIFSMILVLGFLPLLLTLVDKQIFKDQQRFEARSERLQKRIEEERIKRSSRLPAGSEE